MKIFTGIFTRQRETSKMGSVQSCEKEIEKIHKEINDLSSFDVDETEAQALEDRAVELRAEQERIALRIAAIKSTIVQVAEGSLF